MVWGPTCDGLDCVCQNIFLPQMHVDDWLAHSMRLSCCEHHIVPFLPAFLALGYLIHVVHLKCHINLADSGQGEPGEFHNGHALPHSLWLLTSDFMWQEGTYPHILFADHLPTMGIHHGELLGYICIL
jgi:Pyridoxal-dependent decarboxylase, C-terminal sheet domain